MSDDYEILRAAVEREADRSLRDAAPDMASMLRLLEWSGNEDGLRSVCPVCKAPESGAIGTPKGEWRKHDEGCELDALLTKVGR